MQNLPGNEDKVHLYSTHLSLKQNLTAFVFRYYICCCWFFVYVKYVRKKWHNYKGLVISLKFNIAVEIKSLSLFHTYAENCIENVGF